MGIQLLGGAVSGVGNIIGALGGAAGESQGAPGGCGLEVYVAGPGAEPGGT